MKKGAEIMKSIKHETDVEITEVLINLNEVNKANIPKSKFPDLSEMIKKLEKQQKNESK